MNHLYPIQIYFINNVRIKMLGDHLVDRLYDLTDELSKLLVFKI